MKDDHDKGKLLHRTYGKKQVNYFILHTQVEDINDGIEVYSSPQYVGDDSKMIEMGNPFVSVSFNHMEDSFSLDPTTKYFRKGSICHSDEPIVFPYPSKGKHELFINASFIVDGEEVFINHVEELIFQ